MVENKLGAACEATAVMAQQALEWVVDPKNDPKVGQERAFLERAFRSCAYQARRLARSADRACSIGVFGPSQHGKSYLVSVFARKGDRLMAAFDDPARPEVDFITEINPYGEKEATGLVTRFSIHKTATPAGFPVALRLLTQTDILKIIANAYFFNGDQQYEKILSPDEIDRHIAGFESKLASGYVDVLREEDMWDVEEYFRRQIARPETRIFEPFWARLASAAPRLDPAARADLLGILWGSHPPLTDLYRNLVGCLAKLGFTEEAFCPLDALLPKEKGILNVETLDSLDRSDAETLKVAVPGNLVVDLPRPIVTALSAELRMVLKEAPQPFFVHTDLLDFPGYRSRELFHLAKYLREAGGKALKELFLRGKVDYLFQRYTAEQELTSMLLCLKPGNLEVATLPAVIEEWIGVTHGRTPEARRGRPLALFFLLTWFDQHLVDKVSDAGTDAGLRFQSRMEASLLKPFAKSPNSWPLRWTPETSFKNCYWIRNPNIKAEGVIEYDGSREVRVHESKLARIAELRDACADAPEVRAHFREPQRAFDEAMRLNDGGVSYLAENIALICRPGMKQEQVAARLGDLRARMMEALSPFFVPTDADQRLTERRAVAEQVISDFEECIGRQAFGTFLRAICVDRERLADALYEARTRGNRKDESKAATVEPAQKPKQQSSLLAMIKGVNKEAGAAAREMISSGPARGHSNVNNLLTRCALQVWSEGLHETGENSSLAASFGLSLSSLKEVATELVATSRRLGLENAIRLSLDGVSHIDTAEQAVAKATIIAERHINRFVTTLQSEPKRAPIAFDAAGIGERPANFQQEFPIAWLSAFYANVQSNAQSVDGLVHDPEQNARLGQIMQQLEAATTPN